MDITTTFNNHIHNPTLIFILSILIIHLIIQIILFLKPRAHPQFTPLTEEMIAFLELSGQIPQS